MVLLQNGTFINGKAASANSCEYNAQNLLIKSSDLKIDRSIFEKITIPILVKIEDDPRYPYFVIVINHQGDFITILDPSYGKYVSTKEQFYNLWDKHKRVDMS